MEKLIQFWAIQAALTEKLLEDEISFDPDFPKNQAHMYVYEGIRDSRISDHTLQIVAALKRLT